MSQLQPISAVADRVMAALAAGLEIEFGDRAAQALAARFLEAEEIDFLWDARIAERWLGSYGADDAGTLLERIEILGRLDGGWFVAMIIVDGEGCPQGLLGRRRFDTAGAARAAYAGA